MGATPASGGRAAPSTATGADTPLARGARGVPHRCRTARVAIRRAGARSGVLLRHPPLADRRGAARGGRAHPRPRDGVWRVAVTTTHGTCPAVARREMD